MDEKKRKPAVVGNGFSTPVYCDFVQITDTKFAEGQYWSK